MPMMPQTILDAAVRHARLGPDDEVSTRVVDGGAEVTVTDSDGMVRVLRVSTPVAGYPRLDDLTAVASAVLPEAEAVDAIADWIRSGTPLPHDDGTTAPASSLVGDILDRVWDAAEEACAPSAAADGWPTASDSGNAIILTGPRGASLTVRARLDESGQLTGMAWQGRRGDGGSVHGHGSADAAMTTASAWAAGLDDEPAITPAELRARREATGATQTDLARLIGTSQSVVSQWESGARAPRDPAEVAAAVRELEALADDLYQEALHCAGGAVLTVWGRDHDYWATDPGAAQQRTPAAMQRVAAARAAYALTQAGTPVRLVAGLPPTPAGGRRR